jgi:hypothetical protein
VGVMGIDIGYGCWIWTSIIEGGAVNLRRNRVL